MSARHFTIKRGLDLPITGSPEQVIDEGRTVTRVGVRGADYVGLKPTMLVKDGERVRLGQPLFEDKKNPGVAFSSPAAGVVEAVHRGAKRALQSVVIRVEGEEEETFEIGGQPADLDRDALTAILTRSGSWTAFRTRPYSRIPVPDTTPRSIFVNAVDTNPLAPLPRIAIQRKPGEFRLGLVALTKLTDGAVFLATRPGVELPGVDTPGITHATFEGPHPSGLVGTHIHLLDPIVRADEVVWHVNYQDVIAIGSLLSTGRVDPHRVVAIGGPAAKSPRLVLTRLGADLGEFVEGEIGDPTRDVRVVSGSVLSGTHTPPEFKDQLDFTGRYDLQVSLLYEGRDREFLGWHGLGLNKFSIKNVFASALNRTKQYAFTTNTQGSPRAMVPIGCFERVMPLDVMPTFLLRALLTQDTDMAQALGALELDEEDLGLCTFVCPGKTDYGPLLRQALTTIERDG